MTWLLRVLLAMLPAVAWGEGTRVDAGSMTGTIRLEATLTPGLGIKRDEGHIAFRAFTGDKGAAGPTEKIPLTLSRVRQTDSGTTYVFEVPEEAQSRAVAFHDRTGGVPSFTPALSLCRNGEAGRRESISYRLHRPGFESTPIQVMGPGKMAAILPRLDSCEGLPDPARTAR